MARPEAKPAITKAPSRSHPIAPPSVPAAMEPEGHLESVPTSPELDAPPTPPVERKVMYSARVRESLRREVKLHSVQVGLTVEEITEAALQDYLERHRQQA